MNKEELIKSQFPNDEFLQSAVSQIVDKCTADLKKENKELNDKLSKIERKCKFDFVDLLHDVENEVEQEKQVERAKEIIKKLVGTPKTICKRDEDGELCLYVNDEYPKVVEQAKQFIKEGE